MNYNNSIKIVFLVIFSYTSTEYSSNTYTATYIIYLNNFLKLIKIIFVAPHAQVS